jgi:hypothetical protein
MQHRSTRGVAVDHRLRAPALTRRRDAQFARQQQAALATHPPRLAAVIDSELRGDLLIRRRDDRLEALLADPELILDLTGAELLVEAELERRGLLLVERLDDQTQRVAIEPQLGLLVGQGLIIGRRDQRRTERVDRVGSPALGRVGGASPRDLLQQRATILDDLAATLDGEQFGPTPPDRSPPDRAGVGSRRRASPTRPRGALRSRVRSRRRAPRAESWSRACRRSAHGCCLLCRRARSTPLTPIWWRGFTANLVD